MRISIFAIVIAIICGVLVGNVTYCYEKQIQKDEQHLNKVIEKSKIPDPQQIKSWTERVSCYGNGWYNGSNAYENAKCQGISNYYATEYIQEHPELLKQP